ncbi:hypothetical protein VitviT2T_011994 [Vitis vinifera]|uniref:3'-5' exonuclease domain-containing protein n=1 Tax=Vitis vinifera TaxID=29760 RepID=A0ABY9CDI0_VITVI|nr:hypothetical protein VitviT2T_011994 [Vitis vinifera]
MRLGCWRLSIFGDFSALGSGFLSFHAHRLPSSNPLSLWTASAKILTKSRKIKKSEAIAMAVAELERCRTHELFRVAFHDDCIETLVTHVPHMVDSWIGDIEHIHRHRLHKLIVGLDIEWRPNNARYTNPVAILQLCADSQKLLNDHNLRVGNVVDLAVLAARVLNTRELRNAGIKRLAREVLGREVEKPKHVARSRWDTDWLSDAQVHYACVDAFVSFEVGRCLNASAD